MDQFKICCGKKEFKINIEYIKYFCGKNESDKFSIYNSLKSCFSKTPNSEYALETQLKHYVCFNDKIIDPKKWMFFEINKYFDIDTDIKLGTKSLLLKYLESFKEDIESSDIFNTLSILFESFNAEIIDPIINKDIQEKRLDFRLDSLSSQLLLKNIYALIFQKDFETNYGDFNYEDLFIFQLNIIETIASKNKDKFILLYLDISFITDSIRNAIERLKYKNCYVFINCIETPKIDINLLCLFSKSYWDFSNIELINENILDLPFHIFDFDLLRNVQEIVDGKFNDENLKIRNKIF